jgi:hypothetical protein
MLKSIGGSLPTRALRDTAEAVGKGSNSLIGALKALVGR